MAETVPYRVTDGPPAARSAGRDEPQYERLARGLLDALDAPSVVVDAAGVVVVANAAWEALAGARGVAAGVGAPYLEVGPAVLGNGGTGSGRVGAALRQVLAGDRDGWEATLPAGDPPAPVSYLLRVRPLPAYRGAVLSHVDVTALVRAQEAMRGQALHDPLTGLPATELVLDRLAGALARRERNGGLVGVFRCDLDAFAGVNESLGRPAGDELLRAAAGRLSSVLRAHDTVARVAADEFVVVCEGLDEDGPGEVATRLRRALTAPFPLPAGGTVSVTASVGVAVAEPHEDAPRVLATAAAALAEAKRRGGATVVRHEPGTAPVPASRTVVADDLRGAAGRGELVLGFQPLVDLRSGLVSGVETLVRWRHPSLGVLPPATFLPEAERLGCIDEIGAWVLLEACRFLASPQADAAQPLRVGVNVSAAQLAGGALPGQLRRALAETGADPARLVLELSERALTEGAVRASAAVQELRSCGVRLAIDDVGTGYTSLPYLERFPVHALKVDRSLVARLGGSDRGGIVAGVVQLAHSVGGLAVAEGVERRDQVEAVRELGCDLAQGFVWSRPVPRAQIGHAVAAIEGLAGVGDATAAEELTDPAAVRRRIVAMHRAGASAHTIAAALNQAAVPTPRGTRWQAATVRGVVREGLGGDPRRGGDRSRGLG